MTTTNANRHSPLAAEIGHFTMPVTPVATAESEDLSYLPVLRTRVRRHMDAMIRCLPLSQSQAYLEAMSLITSDNLPQGAGIGTIKQNQLLRNCLLYQEADPIQFLRFCNYDLLRAAKRLCRYWTERKAIFGPERAFRPLVLLSENDTNNTHRSALEEEEMQMIRSGFPAFLPDTVTGQKCFFSDRSRRPATTTTDTLLRCLFYLFKVLAEDPLSQRDGVFCLINAASPNASKMDFNTVHRASILSSEIFPVKLNIHVLHKPQSPMDGMLSILALDIVNAVVQLYRHYFESSLHPVKVHVDNREDNKGNKFSKQQIMYHTSQACDDYKNDDPFTAGQCDENKKNFEELLSLGLLREGIPQEFGGDWVFEDSFEQWRQKRIELEKKMRWDILVDFGENMATGNFAPNLGHSSALYEMTNQQRPQAAPLSSMVNNYGQQAFFMNAPNMFTSATTETVATARSNYAVPQRRDAAPDVSIPNSLSAQLFQQRPQQQSEQQHQNQQQERTSQYDSVARAAERKERRRIADVIRSRRKRERERLEVENLRSSSLRLRLQHEILAAERRRLERLVTEADQCVARFCNLE